MGIKDSSAEHARNIRYRAFSVTFKTALYWALMIFLIVSVGGLLLILVWASFWSTEPTNAAAGHFTIQNYIKTYTRPETYQLWGNTLIIAIGVMVWSNVLGVSIAWIVARTNTPYRRVIDFLMIIPYMTPSYLIAVGYIFILGPRIGFVSTFLAEYGINISIYSLWGIIFTKGISISTLPYLLTSASFRNMNPSLEDAGRMSGASIFKVLKSITIPMTAPAITASLLLTFAHALETFSVPAFLGFPANPPILVFSTKIYQAIKMNATPDYGLAIALATTLLLVAAVGLLIQRKATSHQEKYATITGEGFTPRRMDLGPAKWIVFAALVAVLVVGVVLPFIMLAVASVSNLWIGEFWMFHDSIRFVGLDNYVTVLNQGRTVQGFVNSFILATVVSFVTMVLATFISYFVVKVDEDDSSLIARTSGLMDQFAFLPIAIPGLVLAVGFLWLALTLPTFGLYGSLWLLGLAFIVKELPVGTRATHSGIAQVSSELEEQARIAGAGWIQMIRDIIFPLLKNNFLSGYLLLFMVVIRQLSIPAMLASQNNVLLSSYIFGLKQNGEYINLAALSMMLLAVMFTVLLFFRKVLGVELVED